MNAPVTARGTLLGLPAYRVELRYITDDIDPTTGAHIEAVTHSKPFADPQLADIEYESWFDSHFNGEQRRDGRWRLVLVDADTGAVLREFTR